MPAFDENGDLTNHAEFKASVGNLSLPSNLTVQDDGDVAFGIELSWKDESATGIGSADDKLHLVVMASDRIHILHTDAVRSDQSAEITLPVAAGEVHVYSFFGTTENDEYSNDHYQAVNLT